MDTTQSEMAHGDTAHGDTARGDTALGDKAIGDKAIGDKAIGDKAHGRSSHVASVQAARTQLAHAQRAHLNVPQTETAPIDPTSVGPPVNPAAARVKAAVRRAVAIIGSEVRLAAACGVTQPAISKAKLQGRISVNLALAMHRATGGQVSASELRPDMWRGPENVPIAAGDGSSPPPTASPGGSI
jgi:DNA-binding transcriptional regulator YdaS (Cro superfamily)